MRRLALVVALASTTLATPALAQSQGFYAGIEGGLMIVQDAKFDVRSTTTTTNDAFRIDHKPGVDADLIGGFDFGMFRVEAEAGYKRATIDTISFPRDGFSDASGNVRALSVMGNAMLDFSDEASGWSGFVGGGAGLANVRYRLSYPKFGTRTGGTGSDSDRSIAYQAIAGVRKVMSPNVELGLKYRYFSAPKLDYNIIGGSASTKFRSHSLLASLIYTFAPPPPPAPVIVEPMAPPPPPATQTCYDGSVILATDVCPAPPPPAPTPAPERG